MNKINEDKNSESKEGKQTQSVLWSGQALWEKETRFLLGQNLESAHPRILILKQERGIYFIY